MEQGIRRLGMAVIGGLWGGAVAGLAEVALVAGTSSSLPEFGFVPYAVIGYGLLGGVIGAAVGMVLVVLPPLRRFLPGPFGLGAGATLAALVLVVGRYHVNQRFFHEELTPWTSSGALAYLGLVAMAAVAFGLAIAVGRWVGRQRYAIAGAAGTLVALVIVTLLVGRARVPSDTVFGPRPSTTAAADRPNVILVIIDTLRADALSSYGNEAIRTPAIDALASDGVRFSQAFAQASWTRPSIATILTSLYPESHGATHKTAMLRDSVLTVAEAFRSEGYWTAGFVSNINIAPVFNFQQGFAEYTYLEPAFYFWASDTAARLTLYKLLRMLRERFFADRIYAENFYRDAQAVTERTMQWLSASPRRPFFLLVHYMDPHDPYFEIPYDGRGVARVTDPHPPTGRKDELHRLYLDNVKFTDGEMARLIGRLEALDLYRNTLLLVTADHGEEFQEHGGWWHGTSLYEEQLHVPLLLKMPQGQRAGQEIDAPARLVDIGPTLMSAAGLPVPPSFQGHDLFGPRQTPSVLLAEEDLEGNVLTSIRRGPWKLITANPSNPRGLEVAELYNLDDDPHERRNLASEKPGRVSEMLNLLSRTRDELTIPGGFGR